MSLFLTGADLAWGQIKSQNNQLLFWPQYQFSGKISNKWAVQADASYRVNDFNKRDQSVIRGGLVFNPSPAISFTGGYAYFLHFPTDPGVLDIRREHRPWQQITLNSDLDKLQIQHRYRLEERYINNSFNFRGRYQINLQYPLKGKKIAVHTPYLLLTDEIMFNFGKKIVYNHFDQNRIHLAVGYWFSTSISATIGYMYIYQQRSSGDKFENIHAPRLVIHHSMDFRKKEGKE